MLHHFPGLPGASGMWLHHGLVKATSKWEVGTDGWWTALWKTGETVKTVVLPSGLRTGIAVKSRSVEILKDRVSVFSEKL